MRFQEDQKGFTLVELVIVTAIVAIMAALSLTMLGRIKFANTEKMVTNISDALSKAQILAMSKETPRYLHIFKIGNDYYVEINESTSLPTSGNNATALGSQITISKVVGVGGTETEITSGTQVVISFKKDGTLRSGGTLEDIRKIVVKGSYEAEIRINPKTGKHVTEKR